ncbi:MAG: hypothetical protein ABJG41_06445 [Cyclobacteriaceae bacterium]
MKIVLRLSAMLAMLGAIIFLPAILWSNNTSAADNRIFLRGTLILGVALLIGMFTFVFIKIKNQ